MQSHLSLHEAVHVTPAGSYTGVQEYLQAAWQQESEVLCC